MQGKRLLNAISAIVAMSFATGAHATMSMPFGWYVEANVGTTKFHDQTFPSNSSTSETWIAGGANVGYKFMPYFGAEIGYIYYSQTTIKDQFNVTAGTNRTSAWDLAVKGILPYMDSGFELIAKLGIARLTTRTSLSNSVAAANIGLTATSSSVNGAYLGAGGQYYFTPELAVVAQWSRVQGNSSTGTPDFFSLGASWLFS